jgi:hypothetical protein
VRNHTPRRPRPQTDAEGGGQAASLHACEAILAFAGSGDRSESQGF